MAIRIKSLAKRFGERVVFDDLCLVMPERKITAFLGPSGCGKTTLLNMVAGIILPDAGEIDGIAGLSLSYLFQEPRLLPWETAEANLRFVLDGKLPAGEIRHRIDHFLDLTGLAEFRSYYPYQMSGGMKQRLSLARAFAYPSELLLMDEPFQGLDIARKLDLMRSFSELWLEERRTTLFVTHDVQDALILGDEIVVFAGTPTRVDTVVHNGIDRSARTLGNPELIELERRLYGHLIGGN